MNPFARLHDFFHQPTFVETNRLARGLIMNLFARLYDFFHQPNPEHDPVCSEHRQWVADYKAKEIPSSDLVLELAREKYRGFDQSFETLDLKASEVLRTSGLIATILVASIGALALPLGWPIALALFFLLLAMLIALWCRRPLPHPTPPTIRKILTDGSELQPCVMQTWLAVAFHRSAEEYRLVVNWKADRVREATFFLSLGLFVLMLTAAVIACQP